MKEYIVEAISLTTKRAYGEDAEYHIQVVAIVADQGPASFRMDFQYGKSTSNQKQTHGRPMTYLAAFRAMNEKKDSKLAEKGDRVYSVANRTKLPNGSTVASPRDKTLIIDGAIKEDLTDNVPTRSDAKTEKAVSDARWIGVGTPERLIKITCDEVTPSNETGSTMHPKILEDAQTIGSGLALIGYVENDVFRVADAQDKRYPEKILGARLQTVASLIGTLGLKHIAMCTFAITENKKRELLESVPRTNRVAVFINASLDFQHSTYIMHPNTL